MGTETVKEIVFVIGGCRSGKSAYALKTAGKISGRRKIFIATCLPQDDEMTQRVAGHQKERGRRWTTVEAPVYLPEAILENDPQTDVMLIDCLTLWVSNLMMETGSQKQIEATIFSLIDALAKAASPIVLVSNEVGTGIVPENKLARQYRDIVGLVNQSVAGAADKVVWVVAGIPVVVKG